jgi:hypothetical protein
LTETSFLRSPIFLAEKRSGLRRKKKLMYVRRSG